ncbi:MAG: DUF433 domain-containing protein [Thermoanaerobaculia bacterium]
MTDLEKAQSLLGTLSRREKVRVLDWIVRDLGGSFPGIESTPGVSGGEPCIIRTRIPVWALVRARQLGATEADVLRSYPSLRAEDLVHAWSYYESHRDEIERQIQDNEAA